MSSERSPATGGPLAQVTRSTRGFEVSGELSLHSVMALRAAAEPVIAQLLAQREPIEVDLAGVTSADSAAIALMLHWMRTARAAGRQLHLVHIPEQVLAIARASRMDALFGAASP